MPSKAAPGRGAPSTVLRPDSSRSDVDMAGAEQLPEPAAASAAAARAPGTNADEKASAANSGAAARRGSSARRARDETGAARCSGRRAAKLAGTNAGAGMLGWLDGRFEGLCGVTMLFFEEGGRTGPCIGSWFATPI